jgi:hypothetical protein
MKTYILFIFGMFDDHEDVEFFCSDILSEIKTIKKLRYIIENSQNLIVIFDSDDDIKTLSNDVYHYLVSENIKLYFIFERDTMVTAHLPKNIKDFIFKPVDDEFEVRLDYNNIDLDLDSLLDKIDQMGIDSLTPEEKNFLGNFENS